jgi:alanyl-tRNA synthetase
LVNAEHLRFDFSHFAKMTSEELKRVEDMVNEKIAAAIPLEENRAMAYDDAIKMGATALFGEKYGDVVRVIIFDKNYSMELCGGTHVSNTSKIGLFKLTSEGSVAAGVRRIEAVTSDMASSLLDEVKNSTEKFEILLNGNQLRNIPVKDAFKELHLMRNERNNLVHLLNNSEATNESISQKIEEYETLLKKLEEEKETVELNTLRDALLKNLVASDGVNRIIEKLESLSSVDAAKKLAFLLRQSVDNLFCVLAYKVEDKPGIMVVISENLVAEKGLDASAIVRELGKEIQGGGGGQKFFATAGGKDLSGLDRVLQRASEM